MASVSEAANPLELLPVDEPVPDADDVGVATVMAPPVECPDHSDDIGKVDRWLVAATQEYHSGWIDRPLWEHLLAQSGSDETKTKAAYLRTRAKVLQIARRDRRLRRAEKRARQAAKLAAQAQSPEPAGSRPSRAAPMPRHLLGAAAALGLALVAAGAWYVATDQRKPAVAQSSVASGAPHSPPAAAAQAGKPGPASARAGSTTDVKVADEDFQAKVGKLRDADNWNVLVLVASDWTRKEPDNVNAWIQLSIGYAALRQYRESLESATKAAQLAPGNPQVWRNVGQVNLALDQPAEALQAFERAVALDDKDVTSLVQVGLLSAQFARLPQAQAAFDKALLASPDDAGALCGQMSVARQQGRAKDADAIAARLPALGRSCRDATESVSVTVAATQPSPKKPTVTRIR